jgi:anti-anti-sigma regulatory factor/anti-sigma regulatory factor (Ser/Thr protein kinase)
MSAEKITCHTELRFPVAVVSLSGTLTLADTPTVRGCLLKRLADQPTALLVDLSGVIVAEDLALTLFPAICRRAAEWPGTEMLVCSSDPATLATLDRLGLTRYLGVFHTRGEALAVAAQRPVPRRLRQHMLPSIDAPRQARELVVRACDTWRLGRGTVGPAQLIATELVSNAVLHARTPLDFSVVLRERYLHLAVADQDPRRALRRIITPERDEHGRGLQLVDAMAAAWGSVPTPDGKVVWATVRVRPASAEQAGH